MRRKKPKLVVEQMPDGVWTAEIQNFFDGDLRRLMIVYGKSRYAALRSLKSRLRRFMEDYDEFGSQIKLIMCATSDLRDV